MMNPMKRRPMQLMLAVAALALGGGCAKETERTPATTTTAAASRPATSPSATTTATASTSSRQPTKFVAAVRVGRMANFVSQHPYVTHDHQQDCFDVWRDGKRYWQIIIKFDDGVEPPARDDNRLLELTGSVRWIDLGGHAGTKGSYRNEFLRVSSWRVVDGSDQVAGADATPAVQIGRLSAGPRQHPGRSDRLCFLRVTEGDRKGWEIPLLFPDHVALPDLGDKRLIEMTGMVHVWRDVDGLEGDVRTSAEQYTTDIFYVSSWRFLDD
jgi:hypothetical protein